jgi:hypothetical protein
MDLHGETGADSQLQHTLNKYGYCCGSANGMDSMTYDQENKVFLYY